jgi:alpha-D-ribose 1-methylphosphonate 5-triphosphate synthase subunit PhnH
MENQILYDEVFDAQQHYRLILDSMARPGKINIIPHIDIDKPMDINNASALIAFALLNTDASFYAAEGTEVADFIALHTSATLANLENADLVFISGLHEETLVPLLKAGSLSYPENSATIIADVICIGSEKMNDALQLILQGPGVENTATVYVTGLNAALLDELKEQNMEFPLGIDLIITDRDNNIVCIPRSNHFSYLLN